MYRTPTREAMKKGNTTATDFIDFKAYKMPRQMNWRKVKR